MDVSAVQFAEVMHGHELLTNRFYIGELRDGSRAAIEPPIDRHLWDRVQEARSGHTRRHPGPSRKWVYPLSGLLHCAACGHRITGHSGRLRHVRPCAPFKAARPPVRRSYGESYPQSWFEAFVPVMLAEVSANTELVQDALGLLHGGSTVPDSLATRMRWRRERQAAFDRYQEDRDLHAFEAAMQQLDRDEAIAREAPRTAIDQREATEWLFNLPALWDFADPAGRKLLAQAMFERIDVLGVKEVTFTLTEQAVARGMGAAFGSREVRLALNQRYGRGERI